MIAFSGIDCAGKTTQLDILSRYLDSKGVRSRIIWSRGGYTSWVEGIKSIIRRDRGLSDEDKKQYRETFNSSSWKTRLLLWASICDLIRYYGIVFRWIEWTGTMILCDRYIWDTYIDFRIKYPELQFEKWLCWKLLMIVYKKPAHSIIFTIPADESIERSIKKNDIHAEGISVIKERIAMYEQAIAEGKWGNVIDAKQSIDDISTEVKRIIES